MSYTKNLVDPVWGSARPERPRNPVFSFDVKYAGRGHTEKLAQVRQELEKQNARALVVTMLDEVVWLFNLRGSDVHFSPLFFGYAVVSADGAILFVNPAQVGQDVHSQLGQEVQLRPYDEFIPYLKELGAGLQVQSIPSQYSRVLSSAPGRTESADWRQIERRRRGGTRASLHQRRPLASCRTQGYQKSDRGRRLPRESYQRRRCARSILRVVGGAAEPGS
jgi:hypothetical protein